MEVSSPFSTLASLAKLEITGPLMVGRITAAYISAGVAGVHLED